MDTCIRLYTVASVYANEKAEKCIHMPSVWSDVP